MGSHAWPHRKMHFWNAGACGGLHPSPASRCHTSALAVQFGMSLGCLLGTVFLVLLYLICKRGIVLGDFDMVAQAWRAAEGEEWAKPHANSVVEHICLSPTYALSLLFRSGPQEVQGLTRTKAGVRT